jgi:hypothetical protein
VLFQDIGIGSLKTYEYLGRAPSDGVEGPVSSSPPSSPRAAPGARLPEPTGSPRAGLVASSPATGWRENKPSIRARAGLSAHPARSLRRPLSSSSDELTAGGLDAGPDTIAWHLAHHHHLRVSPATVSRYLTGHGMVVPTPAKRPKSSYTSFPTSAGRPTSPTTD